MENIFENAYFSKAYKTRDGRKALYIGYDNTFSLHILVIENLYAFETYRDSGNYCVSTEVHEYPEDIVSEWDKEINEEELDCMAWRKAWEEYLGDYRRPYAEGFIEGYRKAVEQYNNKL